MKFIASFGKKNTFSMDLVPVTNAEHVEQLEAHHRPISDIDRDRALNDADGPNPFATLLKARSLCVGGTVMFA